MGNAAIVDGEQWCTGCGFDLDLLSGNVPSYWRLEEVDAELGVLTFVEPSTGLVREHTVEGLSRYCRLLRERHGA